MAAARTVTVPSARLDRWVRRFAATHESDDPAALRASLVTDGLRLQASDGVVATMEPIAPGWQHDLQDDAPLDTALDEVIAHCRRPWTGGIVLVRRGAWRTATPWTHRLPWAWLVLVPVLYSLRGVPVLSRYLVPLLPVLAWLAWCAVDRALARARAAALDEVIALCRRLGIGSIVLVRRGGYAVAVTHGDRVGASKVGSRYVQSRTAAGGWSQQRFARRRQNQADELVTAVSEHAAAILLPRMPLDLLLTGGDRPLVRDVLAHPRLVTVRALPIAAHLTIGDPKAATLAEAAEQISSVRITIDDGGA